MSKHQRQPQSVSSTRTPGGGSVWRRVRRPFHDTWNSISSTTSSESSSPATSLPENATAPSTSPTSLSDDEAIVIIDGIYVGFSGGDRDASLTMSQDNLRQQIHNELQSLASDQCYDMAFRFAGRRKDNLRLALVITTMTREAQRLIHAHFLRLSWLSNARKENKLDIHVLVADFGPASGPQSNKHDQDTEHPYLLIPSERESLSGSKIMPPSSQCHSASYCTFGAVLQFGDRFRGLGPWHALGKPGFPVQKDAAISYNHGDCSALEDFHSPLSLFYDDDGETVSVPLPNGQTSLFKEPARLPPLQTHCFGRQTSAVRDDDVEADHYAVTIKLDHSDPSHAGPNADWHTFDLETDAAGSMLSDLMCNKVDGSFITDVYDPMPGINVPVTIAAPNGEVRGTLRSESTLYTMGARKYDLAIITMDRPLHRGCSGALVTRGNQLCGTVLVVSETVPWAYIMPARTMLKDMEAVSGLKVRLPDPDTLNMSAIRNVVKASAEVDSVHEDTQKAPYTRNAKWNVSMDLGNAYSCAIYRPYGQRQVSDATGYLQNSDVRKEELRRRLIRRAAGIESTPRIGEIPRNVRRWLESRDDFVARPSFNESSLKDEHLGFYRTDHLGRRENVGSSWSWNILSPDETGNFRPSQSSSTQTRTSYGTIMITIHIATKVSDILFRMRLDTGSATSLVSRSVVESLFWDRTPSNLMVLAPNVSLAGYHSIRRLIRYTAWNISTLVRDHFADRTSFRKSLLLLDLIRHFNELCRKSKDLDRGQRHQIRAMEVLDAVKESTPSENSSRVMDWLDDVEDDRNPDDGSTIWQCCNGPTSQPDVN